MAQVRGWDIMIGYYQVPDQIRATEGLAMNFEDPAGSINDFEQKTQSCSIKQVKPDS